MIDYKKFQFASPPRTATRWFMSICNHLGLGDVSSAAVHVPPPKDNPKVLMVTMVRHPYDWLVSYFYALQGGAIQVPCVDKFVPLARGAGSFRYFIKSYLKRMPGEVGRMFAEYRASTVMRLEDFPWAVMEFFKMLDVEKHSIEAIREFPAINTWEKTPFTEYDFLRMKVCEAETEFCDRYEYDPWSR